MSEQGGFSSGDDFSLRGDRQDGENLRNNLPDYIKCEKRKIRNCSGYQLIVLFFQYKDDRDLDDQTKGLLIGAISIRACRLSNKFITSILLTQLKKLDLQDPISLFQRSATTAYLEGGFENYMMDFKNAFSIIQRNVEESLIEDSGNEKIKTPFSRFDEEELYSIFESFFIIFLVFFRNYNSKITKSMPPYTDDREEGYIEPEHSTDSLIYFQNLLVYTLESCLTLKGDFKELAEIYLIQLSNYEYLAKELRNWIIII